MNDSLIALISFSLGGAIVIVLLAVAAHGSRSRYAARWRCWVWLVVCLRLLIPVSLIPEKQAPPIQLSIPNNVVIHVPERNPLPPDVPEKNAADCPASETPVIEERTKTLSLFQIAGIVWGLGTAAAAGWAILSHLRFLAYLRGGDHLCTDSAGGSGAEKSKSVLEQRGLREGRRFRATMEIALRLRKSFQRYAAGNARG